MTSAQVVETSVTNNNSFQNYTHPDDYTIRTTDELILTAQNVSLLNKKSELVTKYRHTRKTDSYLPWQSTSCITW